MAASEDDRLGVEAIHPAGCDALHNISTKPNIVFCEPNLKVDATREFNVSYFESKFRV